MPQRDPGVYLEDIEYYADAAVRFISTYSLEQYMADEKTRAAVERVLEICGEAMNALYKVAPTVAAKIPHSRDIIGFRTSWRTATPRLITTKSMTLQSSMRLHFWLRLERP
jgi:uncharacterized protein with HEPN domain